GVPWLRPFAPCRETRSSTSRRASARGPSGGSTPAAPSGSHGWAGRPGRGGPSFTSPQPPRDYQPRPPAHAPAVLPQEDLPPQVASQRRVDEPRRLGDAAVAQPDGGAVGEHVAVGGT